MPKIPTFFAVMMFLNMVVISAFLAGVGYLAYRICEHQHWI